MSKDRKFGLGKGLGALLNDTPEVQRSSYTQQQVTETNPGSVSVGSVNKILINQIEVNPYQPRFEFDEEALQELSESIKLQGLIQPITVRRVGDNRYQLISGERRLRATKMAGIEDIPAYVRTANDQQMLEMALIENIQRENLNAIEVALSFQRMIDECSLKQEELGDRVSKNRSTVTNYLRLLKLPPVIQASIRDSQLSMGHARALISVEDPANQLFIFQEIIDKDLSVRKVEELVRNIKQNEQVKIEKGKKAEGISFQYQKIQDDLSSKFATKIKMKVGTNGKGAIEIPFLSNDDLNRILELLDW
ncbi:parB-like partition protein [Pseudopedobacter saltans DSM 12145]|uniref:ParB-like partition protein n=1 Tax=Pseudopedobacter saltans (strain ATCC 51119 / DSM 12145 / JCM 21818 / CCUG 39354 / LMG 10337 / NBRC 100064 / NCIMB 13643) TaxID=762903 RepID=F0SEH6_PSESL|nr:ParB/RepB/Spo0J family partition protein [Pseudopedobacter saltans]ADY50841.1 parB-like partition protein [Pseudopedobacter saltans DSM 12145]